MIQEVLVTIDLVFEQVEKMIIYNRPMFFRNEQVFSDRADHFGWIPANDSISSESLIIDRDGRMIRALRRIQCFVRLGMIQLI